VADVRIGPANSMWEDFEFDAERIPAFKLGFHLAQVLFAFVLWCLEIAVFRAQDARIVGNNGWTFAVVRTPTQFNYMVNGISNAN
jgi:hypothetical protein